MSFRRTDTITVISTFAGNSGYTVITLPKAMIMNYKYIRAATSPDYPVSDSTVYQNYYGQQIPTTGMLTSDLTPSADDWMQFNGPHVGRSSTVGLILYN